MRYLSLFISIPLVMIAGLVLVSNTGPVAFYLFPGTLPEQVPLGWMLTGTLGTGFAAGALFVWLQAQRAVFEGWKQRRRADRLEAELEELHSKAAGNNALAPRISAPQSPFARALATFTAGLKKA